ncbi:3-oxoadipate enol-lactonase [Rhodocaloribacter litoris]|uniref:3-oxoadipate enol-lactonase n=1 Tax=Rhodocaloribacter litoris TaxID=2558931 RepID=UPI0014231C0C|nr:3-oxoadipate enol-lactonase [Rhodocaloribacter litoris]QXD15397.1 3-oxoadipate enol-lactonase [Rhodocaloribacter litoris]
MSDRRALSVNDLTVNVLLEGEGSGVPLVLVHALGTDLRLWDAVVARLRTWDPHRPLLRYDLRGHGLSDAPAPPYTLAMLTDDLIGLVQTLGLACIDLTGISVGGLIAMNLAAKYPGRVRRLVLCDTLPRIGTAAAWETRTEALRDRGMAALAQTILDRWFAPSFPHREPATYRLYVNMLHRTPLDGYLGTCAALRDGDVSDRLDRITAPALVLCGTEDLATPLQDCRTLAEALPEARFEAVPGAAHLPPVEQPDALSDALIRFLSNA